MSNPPEDAQVVTTEGSDLDEAIAKAAEALEVAPHVVAHKIDMSHFRSASGSPVPRDTVKLICWVNTDAPEEAPAKPQRREARSDDRRDDRRDNRRDEQRDNRGDEQRDNRGDGQRDNRRDGQRDNRRDGQRDNRRDGQRDNRGDGQRDNRRDEQRDNRRDERRTSKPGLRGPEEGTTEASDFSAEWFTGLLGYLNIEGTVTGTGNDERVHLLIEPQSRAGRLIGKRGSTLASIRHLLGLALEQYGSPVIDVDVEDGRERSERGERGGSDRDDRGRGRDRDDRGRGRDRDDRGRGRDRDDRGRGRGRDRDRDREENKSRYPEEKIRALARRAAEKARETGKTITINLELNSYDRRLVHLEVGEVDGVSTRSQDRGDKKFVQVIPD
jgi:predicted RNA-binding protein Jag